MLTNKVIAEIKIEVALNHKEVLWPISEFLDLVSFGVT